MAARAIFGSASTCVIAFGAMALTAPEVAAQTADANILVVEKTPKGFPASPVQAKAPTAKLDLPLKYNRAYVADVTVAIDGAQRISIESKSLARALSKFMTPNSIVTMMRPPATNAEKAPARDGVTEVFKKTPGEEKSMLLVRLFDRDNAKKISRTAAESVSSDGEAGEFLELAEWKTRGLDVAYDAQASELIVNPAVDQLRESNLSVGDASKRAESTTLQTPAYFSSYLTMRMNADYIHSAGFGELGLQAPNFAFESAARLGAFVVEGEATLTSSAYGSGKTAGSGVYDFTRHGTRLVYDWPDEVLRIKAGDLTSAAAGFETSNDLLGVSVERSYAQLKPGQSIQPTGSQSFRIDRPSNVDILADGVIIRRLRLSPGNYNLRDLPLNAGATKVTLAIEDDTGLRRTLEFSMFSSASLLAPGLDEWQIASGVRAEHSGGGKKRTNAPVSYTDVDYLFDQPVMNAFYRTGLTPGKTIGFTAQADERTAAGGASLLTETPIGFVTVDLGASASADFGLGWGARGLYELSNLKRESGLSHSFAVTSEYRSANFATGGPASSSRSDQGIKLGAVYSRAITEDVSASVNVSLASDPYSLVDVGRWDANFALTERFTDSISGALSVGYGEGAIGAAPRSSCVCDNALEGRGLHALLRLNYRPDQASTVSLDADSAAKSARLSAARSEGSGLGAWTASVDTGYAATGKSADVNAAASVTGNRADVSIAHAVRTDLSAGKANAWDERSSIRVETSIATADGVWSFGRPVHNSFAIIDPHETLGDRKVTAGSKDSEIGRSDSFGRALVSDISPYVQKRVPYDVDDLPAGYDLGAGAFDLNGPYKSGYRLQAGSAYAVTALGTLLTQNGEPVALLQGTAFEEGKTGGPKSEIFTNKAGRFGAQGLAPGRWIIEMASEPEPIRFALTIPSGATGLFQAGTLKPL